MDVVKDTVKKSGPLGMYRGLESMVYFATPKAAIRFSSKEAFSNMLPSELGKLKGFVAGLGAGACEAVFVTTPQETIKIKLIDDMFKSEVPRFKGFFHGVATIFKDATAQATRFGVFEIIPGEFRNASPLHAAGAGAVLLFQGVDVVKSRMQGLDAAKYSSTMDCARQLYAEGGGYSGGLRRCTATEKSHWMIFF